MGYFSSSVIATFKSAKETLTTLVIAPFPGKNPLSLGMETSGLVERNLAPFLTPNVATASFSYVTSSLNQSPHVH